MRRKVTSLMCSLLLLSLSASVSAQNTALNFDGSTNFVNVGSFVVPTSGDFTVEFWADVPSLLTTPSGLHEFVSQGQSGGTGFYIGYDQASGNLRCGDAYIGTNVACPTGKWFHLALVNSGGTATLYINGAQKGTPQTGYSISATGSNFTIGQQFSGFDEKINGSIDELRIWNVARTQTEIKTAMLTGVPPSTTGLVAYYNFNEGTGSTVGNSTATPGLDGTVNGTATWVSSAIQAGNNALNFDGATTKVIALPNAAYDGFTSGTIEAWINPTVLDATNREIAGLRTDANTGTKVSFHIASPSAGTTTVGMWNGTTFLTITSPTPIPTGTWTHLAFVTNGASTDVYQGATSGTNTLIGTIPLGYGTATGTNLSVGFSQNTVSGPDVEFFNGSIDEVRVWNTALTATQITNNLLGTANGNESGLVAQLSFDEGIAAGTNTDLTTAFDNTPINNHADMTSFALTGGSSNFVVSPLSVILPVVFESFTAVARDGQGYLQWQTSLEENSKVFIIQRSTDGVHFSDLGSVAAAGTSHTTKTYNYTDATPATGTNYYRVKEMDLDSKATYSSIRALQFSATGAAKVAWTSAASGQAEIALLPGSNELYQVIDINGRKLQQGQLSGGKLYLSGMASGVYIINITTQSGNQINTRILVK